MTNHEAARQLLETAKRNGGFWVGEHEWVPLETTQAMYDAFVKYVPMQELHEPMTVGGKPVRTTPPFFPPHEKLK